jgi:hypothetical protein
LRKITIIFLFLFSVLAFSQNGSNIVLTNLNCSGKLSSCLQNIENQCDVRFNFKQEIVDAKSVTLNYSSATLDKALAEISKQTSLNFKWIDKKSVLVIPSKKEIFISGILIDINSSERLANALLLVNDGAQYYTDKNGFFRLELNSDSLNITILHDGYTPITRQMLVVNNSWYIIKIQKIPSYAEVRVTSKEKLGLGLKAFEEISPSDNSIPTLGGETDVLNNLKMLTGIQNVSFGESGLVVRGGGPDQNFILLDGIPVYNTFHLLGLYSIFNSTSINNVKVYKDAFPSKYTSRLSSVIDVSLNNGNKKTHHVNADIGIVSSGLEFNGPIIKDKLSYSISGRRTYSDLLLYPIQRFLDRNEVQKNTSALWYYDFFGKLHYQINDKNDVKLTVYNGGDQLNFTTNLKLKDNVQTEESTLGALGWRNKLVGLQWHSALSNKVFLTTQVAYSQYKVSFDDEYKFNQANKFSQNKSSFSNGLSELRNSYDFDIIFNKNNYLQTGFGWVNYQFEPFSRQYYSANELRVTDTAITSNKISSKELFFYAEDKVYFDEGNLTYGFRFARFGTETINYNRFQPRVLLIQNMNKRYQLRFGLSSVDQFVHLVPNNNLGLPLDIWLPVTDKIKPMSVTQLSTKFSASYSQFQWNLSLFSKFYNNILEYKNGVSLISDANWENNLSRGSGRANGVEISSKAQFEKWQLYGGYTFCRSKRTVEDINEGNEYFSKYDRPHSLNLLAEYQINAQSKLMLSFLFSSGNPVSLPSARYITVVNGSQIIVEEFNKINNFRLPATHHLDVSYMYSKSHKHYNSTLILGVYNIYNQLNPFMVYIGVNEAAEPVIKIRSYLPIMPMLKYSISI